MVGMERLAVDVEREQRVAVAAYCARQFAAPVQGALLHRHDLNGLPIANLCISEEVADAYSAPSS